MSEYFLLSKCSLDSTNGSAVNLDKSSKNDKTPQNDETESNFYDPELKLDGQKDMMMIFFIQVLNWEMGMQSIAGNPLISPSPFCNSTP